MKRTLQTFKYISRSYEWMIGIGLLSILVSLAISYLIFYLTDRYDGVRQSVTVTAPFEITALTFAILIGVLLFIANLKVVLANGVSRRTFLLANLPAAVIAAAAFAIFNLAMLFIFGLFIPIQLISSLIYPQMTWAGSLIYQFALYLVLIVAGWFITLAYYRSNPLGKWIITLAPFVGYGLLKAADAWAGGAIFTVIEEFRRASMQMDMAPVTLLAYAVLLCVGSYLLIRRAPVIN